MDQCILAGPILEHQLAEFIKVAIEELLTDSTGQELCFCAFTSSKSLSKPWEPSHHQRGTGEGGLDHI